MGSLLGLLLGAKARSRRGRTRRRLLVYAALAVGGAAVWQAGVISLLGFDSHGGPVRFDPRPLGVGLAVGVVASGAGLTLLTSRGAGRVAAGAVGLALAVGATNGAAVASLRVAGWVSYDPRLVAASGAAAVVPALAAAWFLGAKRRLRMASVAALGMGGGIVATQVLGLAAVRTRTDPDRLGVVGLHPMTIGIAVALLGSCTLAVLWFLTMGTSTVGDLHAVVANEDSVQIEPWLIKEVLARTASPHAAARPATVADRAFNGRYRARTGAGMEPVWRTMMIWGTSPNSRASEPAPRRTVVPAVAPLPLPQPVSGRNPSPLPQRRYGGPSRRG